MHGICFRSAGIGIAALQMYDRLERRVDGHRYVAADGLRNCSTSEVFILEPILKSYAISKNPTILWNSTVESSFARGAGGASWPKS